MKIEFDKKADALYIELRKGKFHSNEKLDEDTVLDLDKNGKILGIEVLSASKKVSLKELNKLKISSH
jgi:uncharacterized protein YuzE